jgi:hypothetical protein
MPHQIAVSVRATVGSADVDALKAVLHDLAGESRAKLLPFEELPVHFARFVVLDEATDRDGNAIAPSLLFMADIDAPLGWFLRQFAHVAADGLDQIFRHCADYPRAPTPAERVSYLRDRMIDEGAVYINTVGRSLEQVRSEAQLREAIEAFLDRRSWAGNDAAAVRAAIVEFVEGDPTLSWALEPARPPSLLWRAKELTHLVASVAAVLLLSPLLLVGLPFWLVALRIHELRDKPSTEIPSRARVEQLAEMEDQLVKNQFSAIGFVKPGGFRLITVRAVLWGLEFASRHVYNDGNLAGIRTIHFARWVFLDDKQRLIFISNYDGSLESYMDDFIDKVAWGLNAAFSNGVGYPRSRWLVLDGAKDERAFKNYLRNHQLVTQVWYSAYGDLTAVNIANNAAIRRGLRGEMSPADAERWAALL